jgi:putative ABC transport system ATP-binding protein
MIVLDAKKINKFYSQGKIKNHVLKDISLEVENGDFLGIVGPSGSGKTTLLYCLSSLETIDSGEVIMNGKNISGMNDKDIAEIRKSYIGFVFQFYNLIPNITAYENVLLASIIAHNDNPDYIDRMLKIVGMDEYKDYYPNELSGGMQQRIALARALVNNPKIIFADEPTGNLDQQKGIEIMNLLKKLNEEQKITIILVTHNDDYLKYCNRTIKLIDGEFID